MPNPRWFFATIGLLAGILFPGGAPAAGTRFAVVDWDTDKGLPGNEVIAMTQTSDGYLWLGTLHGLARFDGLQFKVFNELNTPGLNSSQIVSLFEDSRSNLWIGTETAGAVLIKEGRAISLDLGRGSRAGRLKSACEDPAGAVWLYTADGQLARHRGGKVDVWNVGPSAQRSLIMEKGGLMWVGMDQGLFGLNTAAALGSTALPLEQEIRVAHLDLLLAGQHGGYWRLADGRVQKWRVNHLEKDLAPYPWKKPVYTACEDARGNLVVGTSGDGIYWFDAEGNAAHITSEQGLSHSYILSLTTDREGNLWVGTDGGGLNRVKQQVFQMLEASGALTVHSVAEDDTGGLWFNSNGGVKLWKNDALTEYGAEQGLINTNGRAMFIDHDQRIWAGSWSGGVPGPGLFQLQDGRFQPVAAFRGFNQEISALHQDRKGAVWVGTQGGLAQWTGTEWKIFTTKDGLTSDAIQAIAGDAEGNLWIGTGSGLNCLRDGKFTPVFQGANSSGEDISSLLVDHDGVLWIGTRGKGLERLRQGKWRRYTKDDGLTSVSISYLLEDGEDCLWIGSNSGLMRARKQALNDFAAGRSASVPCRAYDKADGLPTGECTGGSQPAACRRKDGTLWFPTTRGLVFVDPANIRPNTNPPPVLIESVLIDGRPQNTNEFRASLPEVVIVPPGRERLDIQFTSLNLVAPERARFKYRMEGYETTWIEVPGTSTRTAHYGKLPPRHYRFQVTACNEDGVWNETGSSLAFIVGPPFWQTWWFLTGSGVLLLGSIVGIVHYLSTQRLQRQLEGLRQQQALERERRRIARDIHDQLGASLTQVSMLGELVEGDKNSPADVEAHARQISQTARDTAKSLDEIVWAVNPSNDTLDGLITYLCKYAQEYLALAGLRCRFDVPTQLPGVTLPPEVRHNVFLAAKEAVTNIVRHAHASEVKILLRLEPAGFTLEIEDNGRGMAGMDEQRARSRNGLSNMRKRMEEIGGSYTAEPAAGGGALVRLTGPLARDRIDAAVKAG